MKNTLYQLYSKATLLYMKNPDLRYGQCLFHVLYDVNRELYEKTVGTEFDTFYLNDTETEKLDTCVRYIEANW